MDRLRPWPSRAERRAAIEKARAQREHARVQRETAEAGAVHAERVKAAIERMSAQNHFAATLAQQIALRHRGEGA